MAYQGHPSVDPHRAGLPTLQELHQDPCRWPSQLLESGSALHGQEPKEPARFWDYQIPLQGEIYHAYRKEKTMALPFHCIAVVRKCLSALLLDGGLWSGRIPMPMAGLASQSWE